MNSLASTNIEGSPATHAGAHEHASRLPDSAPHSEFSLVMRDIEDGSPQQNKPGLNHAVASGSKKTDEHRRSEESDAHKRKEPDKKTDSDKSIPEPWKRAAELFSLNELFGTAQSSSINRADAHSRDVTGKDTATTHKQISSKGVRANADSGAETKPGVNARTKPAVSGDADRLSAADKGEKHAARDRQTLPKPGEKIAVKQQTANGSKAANSERTPELKSPVNISRPLQYTVPKTLIDRHLEEVSAVRRATVSNPDIEFIAPKPAFGNRNGISVAKKRVFMTTGANQEKITAQAAGRTSSERTGAGAGDARAGDASAAASRNGLSLPNSKAPINHKGESALNGAIQQGDAASQVKGQVKAPPPAAVERWDRAGYEKCFEMIKSNAVQLKHSGAAELTVVLRPDANTELYLRLQRSSLGIEAHARLDRGDFAALNSQWTNVQNALNSQGVRLAALNDHSQKDAHGGDQGADLFDYSEGETESRNRGYHDTPDNRRQHDNDSEDSSEAMESAYEIWRKKRRWEFWA
ncbi:MAG: hypothetical protein K9N48_03450 [Verrucomicrobia bacterium]|nr:hypothetical protein [Verrucomicrobiota bacterium]MCF7707900.1 hypothetical protein [Verrucomicrobiota bacterium]